MNRWVTFYYDVINKRIYDFHEHKTKEDATKHFKTHYKNYFELASSIKVNLPMTYGFPFRKYVGISKIKYNKHFKDIPIITSEEVK